MRANLTVAELLAEGVRRLRAAPAGTEAAATAELDALAIARANGAALGLGRVQLRQGDWYQPLRGECFDLLVSNPPYVAQDDPALETASLRHEPPRALTPGADALECLRTLARGAPRQLAPGGWVLLEHGATQGADVRRELADAGFRHVLPHRDLAGHERMTEAQR